VFTILVEVCRGNNFVRGYKMNRHIITVEENLSKTHEQMDRKDAICGIIFYVFYMAIVYLLGLLMFRTNIYVNLGRYFKSKSLFRLIFYIPNGLISILPIFIILRLKKQSIASIGIKKEKIPKSIVLGVVGSMPFLLSNMAGAISSGMKLNPSIADNLWNLLYYLVCISLVEELVFRGFLNTRVRGLIKAGWINNIVVGIMFAILHIPFQMVKANMTPLNFILHDFPHLISTLLIHIYFVFLYTRDNNIIAPTIAHTIINFSYDIFV